jgi:hypothetical protein
MSFLKNPFQVKYIPVLICIALAVALAAFTHAVAGPAIYAYLAFSNYITADKPLKGFYLHGYCALAAIALGIAVFALFAGTWQLALCALLVSSLPLSIVFTRKGPS